MSWSSNSPTPSDHNNDEPLNNARTYLTEALQMANLSDSYMNIGSGFISSDVTPLQLLLEERITYLERSIASMQNETYYYKTENNGLKDKLEKIEKEVYQFEQYNRRESVEISGLPEEIPQHKLENIVIDILRRIGVWGLQSYEVVACHKLKRKNQNERTSRVIIRFTNRKRAFQCLMNRKYLKDTIFEFNNLYIHDSLCQPYREIYDECLDQKRNGVIQKVWTYNGIIHLKKTGNYNERPKRIFHINDINLYIEEP